MLKVSSVESEFTWLGMNEFFVEILYLNDGFVNDISGIHHSFVKSIALILAHLLTFLISLLLATLLIAIIDA